MNRKGFMMAEVVVVSAIVMVTIVGLYQSYNKLYSAYSTRLKYYDAGTLYRLGYYRDTLIEKDMMNEILMNMKENEVKSVYKYQSTDNVVKFSQDEENEYKRDTVFLIATQYSSSANGYILKNTTTINGISQTYQDYLSYLKKSTKYRSDYIMIIESCKENTKDTVDDCHYAYLEIYGVRHGSS